MSARLPALFDDLLHALTAQAGRRSDVLIRLAGVYVLWYAHVKIGVRSGN